MTDAYQNRIASAPASIWCDRVGFLPRLQLGLPSCMNDILNGGGAEDFLHWAVPRGTRCHGCRGGECRVAEGTACAVPRQIGPPFESMLFEAAGR